MRNKIAYQGEPGANSHIACRLYNDKAEAVALKTFDQVFYSLIKGDVDLAMIPIENSIAGRVSDIHRLMPTSDVNIIGESFLKIQHCLMALKDSSIEDIKYGQISGAVGTYQHLDPSVEVRTCKKLGLKASSVSKYSSTNKVIFSGEVITS